MNTKPNKIGTILGICKTAAPTWDFIVFFESENLTLNDSLFFKHLFTKLSVSGFCS